jgi:hypothetical protein
MNWIRAASAMTEKKPARIFFDRGGDAAVAEFIRTRGVTRCPTACLLPTQGSVAAADRTALEEYAAARERVRRARVAARHNSFFPVVFARPAAE